jgi:Fur family ferric uptake transcriptional regulator
MREIHSYERKQFEKLFKQEKIDRFEDRFKILEAFLQMERHVTSEELVSALRENNSALTEEFVTDTLELMCHFGFAQKNRFKDGSVRYEHHHLGQHHDHMICTKCGKIIEFENDQMEILQSRIAVGFGFHMLQHRMEIYGICSECLNAREKQMPLTLAKPGERVMIHDFIGGGESRMRLLSMGLRVGDVLDIITNHGRGQVVVSVGFQRYVIGQGMAQKIIVQTVNG